MSAFLVEGGRRLSGDVEVSGAKNSALVLMACCLLPKEPCTITNVPDIQDVRSMVDLLTILGAKVAMKGGAVTVDASGELSHVAPYEQVKEMRASIQVMGPLVARLGRARISHPGGCELGARPIDFHIKGLQLLGVKVTEDHGYLELEGSRLRGRDVYLDFPSVGATENLMAAACMAPGTTVIHNAAKEPEIVDEQNLLNHMGARIRGAGTDSVRIDGVAKLHGVSSYAAIPDRVEAGTLVAAVAMAGGEVAIRNVIPEHQEAVLAKYGEMGVCLRTYEDTIVVRKDCRLHASDVKSLPYPGFPTDMQPQTSAVLTLAGGTSLVQENVFSSRFKHIDELRRMGAQIRVEGNIAVIEGTSELSGARVEGSDLRATAALVIAGLAASGETRVEGAEHLDRGYEGFERKLGGIGAAVRRERQEHAVQVELSRSVG